MYNRRDLTLTNSKIDEICELIRIGVSEKAAAFRCGVKPGTYRWWLYVGRRHLATGLPTLQAKLIKRVEEAQAKAQRINWSKMYKDAPEHWLVLYPRVVRIESDYMRGIRRTDAEEEAIWQAKCQKWYDARKQEQGGGYGTPSCSR